MVLASTEHLVILLQLWSPRSARRSRAGSTPTTGSRSALLSHSQLHILAALLCMHVHLHPGTFSSRALPCRYGCDYDACLRPYCQSLFPLVFGQLSWFVTFFRPPFPATVTLVLATIGFYAALSGALQVTRRRGAASVMAGSRSKTNFQSRAAKSEVPIALFQEVVLTT